MVRILFIVNHFYPELGAVRTEFEIAKELAKRGNEVLVVTTFPRMYRLPRGYIYRVPRMKLAVIEFIDGLKVLRVRSFRSRIDNLRQRIAELVSSINSLLLASLFLAPFYDVILVAGDIELAVVQVGILLKFLWRKPLTVILHDIHPDTLIKSGVIKGKVIVRLAELLIRTFSKWVDRVIVHSYSNAKILSARYRMPMEKIDVVELWADVRCFKKVRQSVDIAKLKRKFVSEEGKFIVSFAGIMNPPQGLDVVIYTARYIKERYPDIASRVVFLLVGDGMEKSRLIKLADELGVNDLVRFFPLQSHSKYIGILLFSDVCLITLRKDYIQPVVPSKLFEIMAAGCPAVLSMPIHSDAVRIVTRHKCGIYAGNSDAKKLADTIISLLTNEKLRTDLSINARNVAIKYYNLDRAVKQYEDIIKLYCRKYNQ